MCNYVILVDRMFTEKAQKVTFICPKQAIQSSKQGTEWIHRTADPVCFRINTWQQKQALYNNVKAQQQPRKKVCCLYLSILDFFFQPHKIIHYHKQHQCYLVTVCLSEHLSCLIIQQFKTLFFFSPKHAHFETMTNLPEKRPVLWIIT